MLCRHFKVVVSPQERDLNLFRFGTFPRSWIWYSALWIFFYCHADHNKSHVQFQNVLIKYFVTHRGIYVLHYICYVSINMWILGMWHSCALAYSLHMIHNFLICDNWCYLRNGRWTSFACGRSPPPYWSVTPACFRLPTSRRVLHIIFGKREIYLPQERCRHSSFIRICRFQIIKKSLRGLYIRNISYNFYVS